MISGTLVKRYKRFLADVVLDDGREVTAHCPNTGAMTGCAEPGSRVWLSVSDNPKRKYPYSWELVETPSGDMACVHSAKANEWVERAIEQGVIGELQGYPSVRREVPYGQEKSRIDLLLERDDERCFVEVKSVTLALGEGLGVFPDAVSTRGQKHLRELIEMVEQGERAVLLFCCQHTGIERVAPADQIDPKYGELFREALAAGVEVLAYGAEVTPEQVTLVRRLSVLERQPTLA